MANSKLRNSSLELLRIIAMLFIVLSHYCYFSNVNVMGLSNIVNKTFLQIFLLGNLGTAIFFIISGYFLMNSKYDIRKILKLLVEVTFYSIVIYCVLCFSGVINFSYFGLIKSLFPVIFEQYWFFTVYIIIYLLSPYIKKFVNSISREEFLRLLIIIITIWSIIPTFTTYTMYGEPFGRSMISYLIGIYLSLYPENHISKGNNAKIGVLLFSGLIVVSSVACNVLATKSPIFNHGTMLLLPHSFVTLFLAVCLFIIFEHKSFNNRLVNNIAKSVFGVYIIHNNPNLSNYLWHNIIRVSKYVDKQYMILHMVVSVLLVYIICLFIDYIRIIIFKNFKFEIFEKRIKKFNKLFGGLE